MIYCVTGKSMVNPIKKKITKERNEHVREKKRKKPMPKGLHILWQEGHTHRK
jgi:hypothetical protein